MYVCVTEDLYNKKKKAFSAALKPAGVGLMTISDTRKVKVRINAKRNTAEIENAEWLLTKLAWCGGKNRASLRKGV